MVSDQILTTVVDLLAPLDPEMFDPICPSNLSPIRVGDKWTGMIIRCLEAGPRRFSELRIPLHGATAKTLTQSLRKLEQDGLVIRAVHNGTGRRVEYQLSALGRSLLAPMKAACSWAEEHWDELLDARESQSEIMISVPPSAAITSKTSGRA
jgi:DNA-binding HxlR family transcriptional regulator